MRGLFSRVVAGIAPVAAFACAISLAGAFAAPQAEARERPQGDWSRYCKDVDVRGDWLEADCRKQGGGWRRNTRINFDNCPGNEVTVRDGHLVCERRHGGYNNGNHYGWNNGRGNPHSGWDNDRRDWDRRDWDRNRNDRDRNGWDGRRDNDRRDGDRDWTKRQDNDRRDGNWNGRRDDDKNRQVTRRDQQQQQTQPQQTQPQQERKRDADRRDDNNRRREGEEWWKRGAG
jgi:hypothetical protein